MSFEEMGQFETVVLIGIMGIMILQGVTISILHEKGKDEDPFS